MSVEDMAGVTARIAEKLKSIGVSTVQKLAKISDDDLLAIPGLGPKTVTKLKQTAADTIKELEKALVELMDKENEERRRAKEEEKPLFDEAIHGPEEKKPRAARITEESLFSGGADKDEAVEETEEKGQDAAEEKPEGADEGAEAGSAEPEERSHEGDGT